MSLPWPCLIRAAEPSDTGLVAHSWVESYYRGSRDVRGVRVGHYRVPMFRRVERILAAASTLVACDPDDRDHLLGWVCWSGPTLHYAYTTQLRRSCGLMGALLDENVATLPEQVQVHPPVVSSLRPHVLVA